MTSDRRLLTAFLLSHAGKSLLWTATDAFSLYILIRILQIPPVLAGTLFILSSFWNAAIDGIWGHHLSRSVATRRMLPVICGTAVLVASAALAILPWLPIGALLPAMAALILFRSLFAILDVPHNALNPALAGLHGHIVMARWRGGLSAVTALAVAGAAVPLLDGGDDMLSVSRLVFGITGVLALLLLAPLPWLMRSMTQQGQSADAPQVERKGTGGLPHRAIIAFCILQMIGVAAMASVCKAILHTDDIFPDYAVYALPFLNAARLLSLGLWSPVAMRIGSHRALSCAYVGSGAAIAILPLAVVSGPANTFLTLTVMGFSMGGVSLLCWSSFSEILVRLGIDSDHGAAARSYGWFTATSKIGLGFSGLLTGAWLSQAQTEFTAQSLWPLALLAAGLCLVSALASPSGRRARAARASGVLPA